MWHRLAVCLPQQYKYYIAIAILLAINNNYVYNTILYFIV